MNPKDDAKPPFSGLPLVGLGSLAVQDPIIKEYMNKILE